MRTIEHHNRKNVYLARRKTEGWYGRRFGKNPRWANPECDYGKGRRYEPVDNGVADEIVLEQVDVFGVLSELHLSWDSNPYW